MKRLTTLTILEKKSIIDASRGPQHASANEYDPVPKIQMDIYP